jgi:hypothetical protein
VTIAEGHLCNFDVTQVIKLQAPGCRRWLELFQDAGLITPRAS